MTFEIVIDSLRNKRRWSLRLKKDDKMSGEVYMMRSEMKFKQLSFGKSLKQ